jgi:hypothetical protein
VSRSGDEAAVAVAPEDVAVESSLRTVAPPEVVGRLTALEVPDDTVDPSAYWTVTANV